MIDEVVVAHIKAVQASADEVVIKAEAGNSSQELAAAKAKLGKIDHEYLQAKAECKRILEEAQNLLLEQSRSEDEFREIVPTPPFYNRADTRIGEQRYCHRRGIRRGTRECTENTRIAPTT